MRFKNKIELYLAMRQLSILQDNVFFRHNFSIWQVPNAFIEHERGQLKIIGAHYVRITLLGPSLKSTVSIYHDMLRVARHEF